VKKIVVINDKLLSQIKINSYILAQRKLINNKFLDLKIIENFILLLNYILKLKRKISVIFQFFFLNYKIKFITNLY